MEALKVQMWDVASATEVQAVEKAFRDFGIETEVKADRPYEDFIAGAPPAWLILIALPFKDFITGFFAAAGEDAWEQLKLLVDRLLATRTFRDDAELDERDFSYVEFEYLPDEEWQKELNVHLVGSILTDDAYKALLELDFDWLPPGMLSWDGEEGAWYLRPPWTARDRGAPERIWLRPRDTGSQSGPRTAE
jgi:hypothetical protein